MQKPEDVLRVVHYLPRCRISVDQEASNEGIHSIIYWCLILDCKGARVRRVEGGETILLLLLLLLLYHYTTTCYSYYTHYHDDFYGDYYYYCCYSDFDITGSLSSKQGRRELSSWGALSIPAP